MRQRVTGFSLGIGLGILFDSLLCVWRGSFVEISELALGIPMIPAIVFGSLIGLLAVRRGFVPEIPPKTIALILLVAWPLAAWGPIAAETALMDLTAHLKIPVFPAAQQLGYEPDWMSTPRQSCIHFQVTEPRLQVAQFYRTALALRGWGAPGPLQTRHSDFSDSESPSELIFSNRADLIDLFVWKSPLSDPSDKVLVCYSSN